MHLAILLFWGQLDTSDRNTDTVHRISNFYELLRLARFTFPQQLFVKWQWAVQCADRLMPIPYSLELQAHSQLPLAPLKSHPLFLLPRRWMAKLSSNKPAHYFEWPNLPQTNRHITFSQLLRHRHEPPWRRKQYVFPKHRNTPSIGQQTKTRPLNTTLTQHKTGLCCVAVAGLMLAGQNCSVKCCWLLQQNCNVCLSVSLRFYIFMFIIFTRLFVCGATARSGPESPHSRGFWITHNDAPQSVGLLWTSDQLVAQTSTWQHTTLTTDIHPYPRWDPNPQSRKASGRRPTP